MIKERLKVQIIRHHDTLLVHGECKGDTIINNHTVTIRQPVRIEKVNKGGFFQWWWLLLIGALLYGLLKR